MKRRKQNLSDGTLETTVEISGEDVSFLQEQGFALETYEFQGETYAEIDVEVGYDIDHADPSVGINYPQANPNSVIAIDSNGKRVDMSAKIDANQFSDACMEDAYEQDQSAYDAEIDRQIDAYRDRD